MYQAAGITSNWSVWWVNSKINKTDSGSNYVTWNSKLLTYSMVQSPSWEANWFAASQEITRISRNPNVHYRTHKHPPPVSILSQPNPVHIPTSHLLEIHPNIIHPSTHTWKYWLTLEWHYDIIAGVLRTISVHYSMLVFSILTPVLLMILFITKP